MQAHNFIELIKDLLPSDMNIEELFQAFKKIGIENNYVYIVNALKYCPRINWLAYRERYQNVANADMDPVVHFLTQGIYDRNKLISWHTLKEKEIYDIPLISIIIINYNNAHLLHKCLDSVIGQTLRDIEIIIVDDCSTDASLSIISEYANVDERIKVIVNERNSATLITRKRGVESATGRYLMFLDSDDFMVPEACEIAYRAMSRGYDMVKFGAYVFNSMNVSKEIIDAAAEWCCRGEDREYKGDEICTMIFAARKMNWLLWANIYLREIVVRAFRELPDEYFTGPDDVLALLAITRHARIMLKIPDKLYFYNYGPGVSLTSDPQKIIKYLPARCNTISFIKEYAKFHHMNINAEGLYFDLCDAIIDKIVHLALEQDMAIHLNMITEIIGFKYILKILMQRHAHWPIHLAALIRPLAVSGQKATHIGIFYPVIGLGGVEIIIQILCSSLAKQNLKVTIFTEDQSEHDLQFPDEVNIVYITPPFRGDHTVMARMEGFEKAVLASGIDIMLHAGTYRPHILWDVLVLHHYNIPVIFMYHFSIALALVGNCAPELDFQELAFKSADAVTCLSTIEEMYLRRRGINALYVPDPILQQPYEHREAIPQKIAVIGRFGSWIKQVGQCLLVLREVIRTSPWVSMILIGDFYTDEQRAEYWTKIRELGIERNVLLTGWTETPRNFLKQCGVLFSASYSESFGMGIAEAQALGLPCVIYDLPIEQTRDNPSIITVAQGDYMASAREIVNLLNDECRWRQLSEIALKNVKKFSPKRFIQNIYDLLSNWNVSMPMRYYSTSDYENLAKIVSFYSKFRTKGIWD